MLVVGPLFVLGQAVLARAGGGEAYGGGLGGGNGSGSGSGFSVPSVGGSSDNGEALFFLLGWFLEFFFHHPLIGILIVGFGFWFLFRGGGTLHTQRINSQIGRGMEDETALRRVEVLSQIQTIDAAFDETNFLARVRIAFPLLQQAWSEQNLAPVRSFLSDGVWERFNRQIVEQKSRGILNRMSDVRVLGAEARAYRTGANFQAAYVWITATAKDEIVSLEKGTVTRSNDGEFREVWTFLRRPGVRTLERPGAIEGCCPSCGATLHMTDAARCGACGTWVNSGEHDWVLVEITQPMEWRFPDPETRVVNWSETRAADPFLSLESLEDRASVAFWRWLDARRRREPAPLRGVASDSFVQGADLDGGVREAAVGAVDVVAFERQGEYDLAHVLIKWEAERPGAGRSWFAHVFVFHRKAGATSDIAQGLSAARCPSCGAPPAEEDAALCAYCGRSFNDGERRWVLERIVPLSGWRPPVAVLDTEAKESRPPDLEWGRSLSPRSAVATLVLALFSDGVDHPRELRFLNDYAKRRGIDEATTRDLLEAARGNRLEAPRPTDDVQAMVYLRGLVRMCLVDGRLDSSERTLLILFGEKFGLKPKRVETLINEERAELRVQTNTAEGR